MFVPVVDKNQKPLMPTTPPINWLTWLISCWLLLSVRFVNPSTLASLSM